MKTYVTFMRISQYILLRMRRFIQICKSNQNKHFMFNFFLSENHAVYEILGGGRQ